MENILKNKAIRLRRQGFSFREISIKLNVAKSTVSLWSRKEVLDEKGIKQTWLAEQLGKSYNMVNAYVQNRQQPRIEVLYDIAKILDVNVKDLLIDNDNKKNKK